MLPLDGLWLNASKPEPSLETYSYCSIDRCVMCTQQDTARFSHVLGLALLLSRVRRFVHGEAMCSSCDPREGARFLSCYGLLHCQHDHARMAISSSLFKLLLHFFVLSSKMAGRRSVISNCHF